MLCHYDVVITETEPEGVSGGSVKSTLPLTK